MLDAKLDEELAEWREASDPAELADLLDVVRAVAIHHGIGWEQLQQLAADKRERCGELLDGVIWTGPETTSVISGDMAVELPGIEPDRVVDLMEALEQSVAAAKAARQRRSQPTTREEA